MGKEKRSGDWFAKKAYLPKSLKRGKSQGTLDPRVNTWSQDFYRTRDKFTTPNDNTDTEKVEYGYIHDNSYRTASDPNTMIDVPGVPRSF